MKYKVVVTALIIFSFWLFLPSQISVIAASYLENDGNMSIQTDRLQISEEEKNKKKAEQELTVLDQKNIPLFTEEMDKKLAAEKKVKNKQLKKWQASIFNGKKETASTVTRYKAKLFNKQLTTSNREAETNDIDDSLATKMKTIGGVIAGIMAAIGVGIYVACRKVFE